MLLWTSTVGMEMRSVMLRCKLDGRYKRDSTSTNIKREHTMKEVQKDCLTVSILFV